MRTSSCKQAAGAEVYKLHAEFKLLPSKWSSNCWACGGIPKVHDLLPTKAFRMFNSARKIACEVVAGAPHKHLQYNRYVYSHCLQILLAAVGLCTPNQGIHSGMPRQDWTETSTTSHKQCHYVATVHASDAQLPKCCFVRLWCDEVSNVARLMERQFKYLKLWSCSKGWFVQGVSCVVTNDQDWSLCCADSHMWLLAIVCQCWECL